ncbi:MAG: response regulator [Pseudomonadota bacterium]
MSYSILIVDDSLPMRGIIKKTLRAAGFGACTFLDAVNGKQALEILDSTSIDLVITDFTMPVMNGFELISAMKSTAALDRIPVVMVTSEGSREKIDQFREKGAAGYIRKPFTPEQLRDVLASILEGPDHEENPDDPDSRLDF